MTCSLKIVKVNRNMGMDYPESAAWDLNINPFKRDFPLLENNPEIAFLDSAATSQRPACVLDAQRSFYETMNSNPLRGLYRLSVEATEAIDETRAKVAHFIGAPAAKEIVFTRNASESLNILARQLGEMLLKPGDEVCISIMEHHSNLIPWQQICARTGATLVYLRTGDDAKISQQEIEEKIGPKTKIVSVAHVSNVLGVENDIPAIARRAHEMGALCLVDGAQSAPHIRVNVAELGCDAFVFSGHKLFAPMGVGVLWAHADLLEKMPPFLTGGEMIEWVSETEATWAELPHKFEAGTQDAGGIVGLGTAIDYIEGIGHELLEARERALVAECTRRLQELPFIRLIGPERPEDHIGVVSFNVCGVHPHDVASILDGFNVCIRAGHHCAQPLLSWMKISSCCRASVALYNDATDIDRLVEALNQAWTLFNPGA